MKRLVFLSLAVALLAGCARTNAPVASQTQASVSSRSRLQVAASFYPLAYFAMQIGGDAVDVTQITPGGVEPHDYDPTPQQLIAVQSAHVFLMNGEGVDAWGDKILDDVRRHGVIAVRMTDTITPMGGFNEQGEEDPTQPSSADADVYDPHIWLDPVLAGREVALIRNVFVQADPDHQDTYLQNADALMARLSALDGEYRTGLAQCAVKDAVVSHNAFRYMAKEYGFQTLAIAGLDPDQEPSPKRLAELADLARRENIHYIFFETLVSPKLAQTVAAEIGAQSLVLNPIEGLTSEDVANRQDYLGIMRENLQNLRTALQCI